MRARSRQVLSIGIIAVCIMGLVGCASVMKLTGGTSLPAPIGNPGVITLPTTFESVWYWPKERGLSLKAYSASGTLVISEDAIDFRAGDNSIQIPISSIRAIAWGKVGQDIANDWAIIEFASGDKLSTAYFKDGSKLGHGRRSDLIYATIKYAAVVRGGVKPNPGSFYSGWITKSNGGVSAEDGKLDLMISLSNKATTPIWANVMFSGPANAEDCKETVRLSPDENKWLFCAQDRIYPNATYSILIDIYLDENQQTIVDRNILEQTWDQADVAAIEEIRQEKIE